MEQTKTNSDESKPVKSLELPSKIATLLRGVRSKEDSRYAIKWLWVSQKRLLVSDGRQAVVIEPPKNIVLADGPYVMDGSEIFQPAEPVEKKFPNVMAIMPPKTETARLGDLRKDLIAAMVKHKILLDVYRFAPTLTRLDGMGLVDLTLHAQGEGLVIGFTGGFVVKSGPGDGTWKIRAAFMPFQG